MTTLARLFLLLVEDRNRIQIRRLENVAAIKAVNVIHTVASIEEFGSLVLTTLHSKVTPILDCAAFLSRGRVQTLT
jgi:hypothetical protein